MTKLLSEYTDRLRPPNDGYVWHQFLKDQESRPLVWHGTSAVFRESIRRTGLDLTIDRPQLEVIARLLKLVPIESLEGRSSDLCNAILVLSTFTQSTASEKTLCFTFDYVSALDYAVRYRGGETLHHLLIALDHTVRECSRALQQSDLQWVHIQQRKFTRLLSNHRPLLLGVRFDPELFESRESLAFLNARSALQAALKNPLFPAWVTGYYSPKRIIRGVEFRASRPIPPERIEPWIELDESDQQRVAQFFSGNPLA